MCLSVQTLSLLTYERASRKELCFLDIQFSGCIDGQLCLCRDSLLTYGRASTVEKNCAGYTVE